MKIILRIISVLFLLVFFSCSNDSPQQFSVDYGKRKEKVAELLKPSLILIDSLKFNESQSFLDSLRKIALNTQDSLLLSGVFNNEGLLNYKQGFYDESIKLYKESLDLDRALNDSASMASKLKNIGISFKQRGNYQGALEYYQKALPIAQFYNIQREEASINNSIGNIYNDLNDFQNSFNYYQAAQKIWVATGDSLRNSYALSNIGNSLLGLNRIEEAISTYKESLLIKYQLNKAISIAITLNNLGEAYFAQGSFKMAEDNYLESLRLRESVGQTRGIALVCNNLATLYIERNQISEAKKWLERSLNIANQGGLEDVLLTNLGVQKKLYSKIGDFEKAFNVDIQYDELKQDVFNKQIVDVNNLRYQYDLSEEEKEKIQFQSQLIESQKREEAQQLKALIQTYVLIIIILIAVIIGYFAYKLRKQNRHIENLMRELHHRVKNHLGMISGMFGAQTEQGTVSSADLLEEAKTRVEAVNGIHRRLYRQDEYEFVNMQEYLTELVDNSALVFGLYHNIQKELSIDSEPLEIDKAISVGLIANEVLTNAFKYGLQKTEEPYLKIALEKAIKGYRMVIFNNAEPVQEPITESTGFGSGFGSELIRRLTANLKGESKTIQQNGFQFELTFP